MPDPTLEVTRWAADQGFDTLRRAVGDLPAEALNWLPANPEDTNSIAVLVTHAAHATRVLLSMAAGLPAPARDRDGEFAAVADGPESLLALIDRLEAECREILDGCADVDWGVMRQRRRDDGSVSEMSALQALLLALIHLHGHSDEAMLTRHLWRAQH